MAISMAKLHFDFPSVTGPQQLQSRKIDFGRTVQNMAVILQGFDIQYNNGDHHVLQESIEVSGFVLGRSVVDVFAFILLRAFVGALPVALRLPPQCRAPT